jgi:hypothetical protein
MTNSGHHRRSDSEAARAVYHAADVPTKASFVVRFVIETRTRPVGLGDGACCEATFSRLTHPGIGELASLTPGIGGCVRIVRAQPAGSACGKSRPKPKSSCDEGVASDD